MSAPSPIPAVVKAPWQVDHMLRRLGLTREIVNEIALAAVAARAESLAVDPNGAGGLLSYIHGVRMMRLRLLPLGWEISRQGNVEATVNHKRGVQLLFQNVFAACGPNDPEAISGKGSASRDLVKSGQMNLFGDEATASYKIGKAPTVWVICVSSHADSYRVEVSCPDVFEGDQFGDFNRRLFVVDGADDSQPTPKRGSGDDGDLDLDIAVTRK